MTPPPLPCHAVALVCVCACVSAALMHVCALHVSGTQPFLSFECGMKALGVLRGMSIRVWLIVCFVCAALYIRGLVCIGQLSSVVPALTDGWIPGVCDTTRSPSPPKSHRRKTTRALRLDR
ncbi:hypothetical protein B0J13DRAFT_118394 [Dactylonectria estremocensis]|uniref:Uncharacterized protein n=1 Tax=Dactylonectria estremocensis TaxID=1079267 RepID=A0A9P9FDS0_9HYPO|nr:hypothetical protein B0J13DRAFT_118394 [Dactylonectria estremocensis]